MSRPAVAQAARFRAPRYIIRRAPNRTVPDPEPDQLWVRRSVFYLNCTLESAAANLALDEALLDQAESSPGPLEILRIWEAQRPMVVVGRASRVAQEVDIERCRAEAIPVLRRCSGGLSIVTGPGCLMYAVVLSYRSRPSLRDLSTAHQFVLGTIRDALAELTPGVEHRGTSDLALAGRKFSGNSVRCKRDCLLYHGTILYDFPLELISRLLRPPPRAPDYRQARPHAEFVVNLPAVGPAVRQALVQAWGVEERLLDWDRDLVAELVQRRYGTDSWNYRL